MNQRTAHRRQTRQANSSGQIPLSLAYPDDDMRLEKPETVRPMKFVEPDPGRIQIDLKTHLINSGYCHVFVIDQALKAQDWSLFEAAYRPGGRPPYAPRLMAGLIAYGTLIGKSSLRELESVARDNISALWLTGGIMPDHSAIGRFIQHHAELLTDSFFSGMVQYVLEKTGSDVARTAGDATVIEGAGSRFATVKREALEKRVARARDRHEQLSRDKQIDHKALARAKEKLSTLEQAEQKLIEREAIRKKKGKDPSRVQINANEPDAVNQPLKHQGYGSSYKPGVIANANRIIVGHGVHASSEPLLGVELLKQAGLFGQLHESSWDAGYCAEVMLEQEKSQHVRLLIPEGQTVSSDWTQPNTRQYPKSRFRYDAKSDTYRCPADKTLTAISSYKGNGRSRSYVQYGTSACKSCGKREQCTTSKSGRRVKRYKGDSYREVMRERLLDESTRERYRQRAGWVEPVFSQLRLQQGLNRFRRKGLDGVKVEFAIHAAAYNLGRLIALCQVLRTLYKWRTTSSKLYRANFASRMQKELKKPAQTRTTIKILNAYDFRTLRCFSDSLPTGGYYISYHLQCSCEDSDHITHNTTNSG